MPARRLVGAVAAGAVLLAAVGGALLATRHDPARVRVVCAQDLTLRDHPGGATRGVVYTGDRFSVERQEGSWSYGTTSGGTSGWVLSRYLRAGSC